jgi:hypothetical protein
MRALLSSADSMLAWTCVLVAWELIPADHVGSRRPLTRQHRVSLDR